MKITMQEFNSLYSDDITKKEHDRIIQLINSRVDDIIKYINPFINNRAWYAYSNVDYRDKVGGDAGYFDIEKYKENIQIGGEYLKFPAPYDESFEGLGYLPTRWLWEDFEEEYLTEIEKAASEKARKEARTKTLKLTEQNKKLVIQNQIRAKLTEEELKYINFK